MDKNKTFSPKGLKGCDGPESFTVMSRTYFKVAEELRQNTRAGKNETPGHFYVFPSVILYVSALEAFLSEFLALALYSNKQNEDLNKLKAQEHPYHEFKPWLKRIFLMFDPETDTGGELFQNIIALKELRNSAAHYNPYFINHINWPKRLKQVLNKSKIDIFNSGWVSNLSSPEVADWAYETTKAAISKFCEISGWENPFNARYPSCWE